MTGLYEPIWRFFESVHNYMAETWDRIVEKLSPFVWAIALFNLAVTLLLLVILLRGCFR